MFVLREDSTFEWPVKASVPVDGKKSKVQFRATFNVLDSETQNELVVDEETRNVGRFLELALVRFCDLPVQDGAGNEITDDEERNRIIRRNPIFMSALVDAYAEGILGYKSKN